MLGWKILTSGDYKINLPILSEDEESLIVAVEERFKESSRLEKVDTKEQSYQLIRKILGNISEEFGIYLDSDQLEYISQIAALHIYGFSFIDLILQDQKIEEISIIGPNLPVYVFVRNVGWQSVNAIFRDEKTIADIINKMARSLGRHITLQNPRLDAMLPDGSRLHASLPPLSKGEMTIRKFRNKPYSPREIYENGIVSAELLAFLSIILQSDNSIIIAGNTASGKTTTLNGLFSFIPATERIIITEETPEINIPHPHQLRLVANKDMNILLKDLVYDTLRMRPDRMIVGEVRNKEEIEALFDVLLAGQARGNYATMHGQSVEETIARLKTFGIKEMDLETIDCMIVQKRSLFYDPLQRQNLEMRKITEVAEFSNGIKKIYSNSNLLLSNSKLLDRAAESFGFTQKEIQEELGKRMSLIKTADPEFFAFFKTTQKELYNYSYSSILNTSPK